MSSARSTCTVRTIIIGPYIVGPATASDRPDRPRLPQANTEDGRRCTVQYRRSGTYCAEALYSPASDKEADAILARANVAHYAAGQEIFAKGDPGNSLMAVLRGRVQISTPSADGRQIVLNFMHGGDVFGEIALLDGKERTADATALTDSELLVVPRGPFIELLERRPDIGIGLLIVLCDRLRRNSERVEDLAFLDLETRIAKTLLRLGIEAEAESEAFVSSRFEVKISQRALGELVGGSREAVNKVLHNWKRSGIIEIERGSIVIRDRDQLADYV